MAGLMNSCVAFFSCAVAVFAMAIESHNKCSLSDEVVSARRGLLKTLDDAHSKEEGSLFHLEQLRNEILTSCSRETFLTKCCIYSDFLSSAASDANSVEILAKSLTACSDREECDKEGRVAIFDDMLKTLERKASLLSQLNNKADEATSEGRQIEICVLVIVALFLVLFMLEKCYAKVAEEKMENKTPLKMQNKKKMFMRQNAVRFESADESPMSQSISESSTSFDFLSNSNNNNEVSLAKKSVGEGNLPPLPLSASAPARLNVKKHIRRLPVRSFSGDVATIKAANSAKHILRRLPVRSFTCDGAIEA